MEESMLRNIYSHPSMNLKRGLVIRDTFVYGLQNAVIKSGNPHVVEPLQLPIGDGPELSGISRGLRLSKTPQGSGHDCFLKGIIVQFDVNFSQKVWQQVKRYHWLDFISSCSTMHCITKMDLGKQDCKTIGILQELVEIYKYREDYPFILEDGTEVESKEEMFEILTDCIPSGFRLWASMTTNYLQLRTIYAQRKNHRLSDQREFCKWMESLPMSELIIGK